MAPRVSIITPLYNKERYIADTIRSVQNQSCPDWEMIVVENGSTDDGPRHVEEMARQDCRIRLLRVAQRGPGFARNSGIRVARGDWVVFLDADDLLGAAFLERYLDTAATHPAAKMIVGCWQEFRDGQESKVEVKKPAGLDEPSALLDWAIAFAPWAVHAAIVRRDLLTQEFLWPETLDRLPSEDTAFWFPLVTRCTIAYTTEAGALYRFQTSGCRHTLHDAVRWFEGVHAAVAMNLAFLGRSGKQPTAGQCDTLMRLYSGMYLQAQNQHQPELAGRALDEANRWLKKRVIAGTSMSLPLRVRCWLGLRIFLALRRWLDLTNASALLKVFQSRT